MTQDRTPRKGDATRARIREAATREFAEFGISGARIDRIAAKAHSNKQLIYSYFGSKEELFKTVLKEAFASHHEELILDPADIPGYVAALFDAWQEPDHVLLRLVIWERLERDGLVAEPAIFEQALIGIAEAQANGLIRSDIPAAELLAMLRTLAMAWALAPYGLRIAGQGEGGGLSHEGHRAAVIDAVRRMIAEH